jgi:N-acetylglucosaminyldiphosphoundecaprenol N-acetyl-beta-D-mannosaminyltransferase
VSLYFLGARPGVAEEAARRQQLKIPCLQVAGCRDGYFSQGEEAAVVESVRASGAAILLVAMGAPRQETLLYRHRDEWGVAVVSGLVNLRCGRAIPRELQNGLGNAGVEWLYRLAREPRRLRRQLALPRYVYRVVSAFSETGTGTAGARGDSGRRP